MYSNLDLVYLAIMGVAAVCALGSGVTLVWFLLSHVVIV
jgi:hypothetical protein